jgi:hypothetical protein
MTPAAGFAEPGTLSSTAPTDFPLPRTAARVASFYRRPVLGAGGTLRKGGRGQQGLPRKKIAQIAEAHDAVVDERLDGARAAAEFRVPACVIARGRS